MTPVTLFRRMDGFHLWERDCFSCNVHLCAEFPDVPTFSVNSGRASTQLLVTPAQAREMADMLIELADTVERAQAGAAS